MIPLLSGDCEGSDRIRRNHSRKLLRRNSIHFSLDVQHPMRWLPDSISSVCSCPLLLCTFSFLAVALTAEGVSRQQHPSPSGEPEYVHFYPGMVPVRKTAPDIRQPF